MYVDTALFLQRTCIHCHQNKKAKPEETIKYTYAQKTYIDKRTNARFYPQIHTHQEGKLCNKKTNYNISHKNYAFMIHEEDEIRNTM
mmetsp:Transcript_57086/g.84960  ORF Transcript_57086/g.84960 Transcript_57086/m.84960 type:complete len:87 (-) Transcript_57086:93-353(-)